MGYSYVFRVALAELPEAASAEEAERLQRKLAGYGPLLAQYHAQSLSRDWYFRPGEPEHSGSRGYGTGPGDQFEAEARMLGRAFPDLTFRIYAFYWDFLSLRVFRVKGGDVEPAGDLDFEDRSPIPGMSVYMSPDNVEITNEITETFTSGEMPGLDFGAR